MTTAIKFIQDHGIDRARCAIEDHPRYANFVRIYNERTTYGVSGFSGATNLADLKRLVESVDLVNLKGGVKKLKKEADCLFHNDVEGVALRYEQAIADYEEIYLK